jgi:hypothetical protein
MNHFMSTLPRGKIYIAKQHGPRLSVPDMSKIYRDSIFVPCPKGALSVDSFRVTEALEAGCIPIVEKSSYWRDLHGDMFPAVQIDSWEMAPKVVEKIYNDKDVLTSLGRQCQSWWEQTKLILKGKIEDLVTSKMQI